MNSQKVGRILRREQCRREGVAQALVEIGNEWFPDLYTVIDEAVNCRNYYVHGTTSSFDYDRNFDLVNFFTNTLEFVFAASDPIEAGWDFHAWASSIVLRM